MKLLQVFLRGLWNRIIKVNKFDKFFTTMAVEWAQDAWWDVNKNCMVTIPNAELNIILKVDKDLTFMEKAVEADLSQVKKVTPPSKKLPSGILSTGSISTFKTTRTIMSKSINKSTKSSDQY